MDTPGRTTTSITNKRVLASEQLVRRGVAMLSSTIVDGTSNLASNISSAYKTAKRVPAGLVVVNDGSGSNYVEANDPGRLDGTAPSVTSAEDVDAGWASTTITMFLNEEQVAAVTLSGTDDTVAEVVSALDGDAAFAEYFDASASTNRLVITCKIGGAETSMRVQQDLNTAWAEQHSASSEESAYGTSPKYAVVLDDTVVLQNEDGTAADKFARVAFSGTFDASELTSLTGEARDGLTRQGSMFV